MSYENEYYTEAYRIILSYGEEKIRKLPPEVQEKIKSMADKSYDFVYDPSRSFKEQGVKKEAAALLVSLKLDYDDFQGHDRYNRCSKGVVVFEKYRERLQGNGYL